METKKIKVSIDLSKDKPPIDTGKLSKSVFTEEGFFAFLAGLSSVPNKYWPSLNYLDGLINGGGNDS